MPEDFVKECQKELKKRFELEIEKIKEFDPDKFLTLIIGVTRLSERKLLPEEDLKELREKIKKKMKEVV